MKIFLTVVVTIVVLVAAFFAFIFSGVYDVAADRRHTAALLWVLSTTMDRSVEARAGSVSVPAGFEQMDTAGGAAAFNEMCVNCHGGPGRSPAAISRGMNPHPPDLRESAGELSVQQIYWIARHGIKMTGMPAFGQVFSDREIWAITAYVKGFQK